MTQKIITQYLKSHGLICQTFAFKELPKPLQNSLSKVCDISLDDNYLSLIANAGGKFWDMMKASDSANADTSVNPVDEYSIKIVNELLNIAQLTNNAEFLYPNRFPAPLMALGEQAGWSSPSPLGLGLHREYGPWFAYRALIKTTHPLQNVSTTIAPRINTSACLTCVDTPCVSACPVSAVNAAKPFSIDRCADFRVQKSSPCKLQCHARNACPVGVEYQYSEAQRAHHMAHALDALIAWSSRQNTSE